MEAWYRTDNGKLMDHNEDTVVWVSVKLDGAKGPVSADLLFVADGVGGSKAGELACSSVARLLSARFCRLSANRVVDDEASLIAEMGAWIRSMGRTLKAMAEKDPEVAGMATTHTAAMVFGDTLIVGHAGDSRLYNFADGELRQITKDHSMVQEMLDKGEIGPEEKHSTTLKRTRYTPP